MNHKIVILGLCALTAFAALLVFGSNPATKSRAPANQGGSVTMEPQREGWAKFKVTMEVPKAKTNTADAVTNSVPSAK